MIRNFESTLSRARSPLWGALGDSPRSHPEAFPGLRHGGQSTGLSPWFCGGDFFPQERDPL